MAHQDTAQPAEPGYAYRVAYGAWVNDMRLDPLPLEQWPAPQLDDETERGLVKAMEFQTRFGYNYLDAWGFFATSAWPLNIGEGVSAERRRRVRRIIRTAHDFGLKLIYGMGAYSWGYDTIIESDPDVRGKKPDGTPHAHAMCDANPKAFDWVKRILDFVLSEFDFDGVHLESCDLGGCWCPECSSKEGPVAYHSRINSKTAQYIRSKWPEKLITVIPISWISLGERFSESDKSHIVELSRHIDCFMDQGHRGTLVADRERSDFTRKLHCAYGTSGGLWVYPGQRWDRESYFLPCTQRQGKALKKHFREGARGCMHYQGPTNNPGTEVNIAFGGSTLLNPDRPLDDVLAEILEELYVPKTLTALRRLVGVFKNAENAYFGQWGTAQETIDRFQQHWNGPPPGELYLDDIFGDSPGPAGYLAYPQYLDADGRRGYKAGLMQLLRDVESLDGNFDDAGRLKAIMRSIIITLTILNTIMSAKGESS